MSRTFATVVLGVLLVASAGAQNAGSALRKAVFSGDVAQVQRLATSKAVVNSANGDGLTALMIASALGHTQIVKVLITAGANLEATTADQKVTALFFSADLGQLETAQTLLAGGAKFKATDKDGYSAIDYAVIPNTGETDAQKNGSITVAKLLEEKGAELKKDSSSVGAGVGSTLGNLLAVISQPDLAKLIDKARAEGQ